MADRDSPTFDLFVYGSLKPGEAGHELFCREALRAEPARVRGALFEAPEGYPVLLVTEAEVLAEGTENPARDARRALRHGSVSRGRPADHAYGIRLRWIDGFVLRFAEPNRQIPPIDEYEDFVPGTPGPYRRVLIATAGESAGAAWTYISPPGPPDADHRPIPSGVWRSRDRN
jgi:gamma-glutamylcyclotransferase (GGCT)/AIG2-like uncharacterized protein YtfP